MTEKCHEIFYPLSCTLSLSETSETVKQQIASSEEDLHLILRRLGVLRRVYCNSAALVYGLFNNLSQWWVIILSLIQYNVVCKVIDT